MSDDINLSLLVFAVKNRNNPTMDWLKRFRRYYIYPMFRPLTPYRTSNTASISVYFKHHLDGGGRGIGHWFIPFLQSRGMPKQRRIFEWCAGPGFIGFALLAHGLCESVCLADVNPEAVAACRRTVEANRLSERVSVYRSNNLRDIPATERWDLVVSNSPHFEGDYVLGEPTMEYPGDLRLRDRDWSVHREFFANVSRFLNPNGVILLEESTAGSTVDTFQNMIHEAGLEVMFVQGSPGQKTTHTGIYWIGIKRAGDTTPPWAIQL